MKKKSLPSAFLTGKIVTLHLLSRVEGISSRRHELTAHSITPRKEITDKKTFLQKHLL